MLKKIANLESMGGKFHMNFLVGMFSANKYLTRSNIMKVYDKYNVDTAIYDSVNVARMGVKS